MQESGQEHGQIRTGKQAAIWLSLLIALAMHALFLYLPVSPQTGQVSDNEALLELRLNKRPEPPVRPENGITQQTPKIPEQEHPAEPKTTKDIHTRVPDKVAYTASKTEQTETTPPRTEPFAPYARTSFEDMTETEKQLVTSSILSQQFIREKPVTEQLFGRPLADDKPGPIADFHYPVRAGMLSMLDTPMPDLPFAYQENLIHFAYDPGVRGDLQKFWDVITPEFGWRTKYGTEVRCIWVLVIAACGWK